MPYSYNDSKKLEQLLQQIESYKEHENASPTFRASQALKSIYDIVVSHLEKVPEHDKDTLTDSIAVLRYLTVSYMRMCRIAYAQKTSDRLIALEKELYVSFSVIDEECEDDYYNALRLRNYYEKCDIDDLSEAVAEMIPDSRRKEIEAGVKDRYPLLKHDVIELSDKYLSVIDETERRMYELGADNMTGFEKMKLRKKLLSEYGVEWKSPVELNPNVIFD